MAIAVPAKIMGLPAMNHKFPAKILRVEAPRDHNTLGLYKSPPGHRCENPTIKPIGSVMDAIKSPRFSRVVHWPFLY